MREIVRATSQVRGLERWFVKRFSARIDIRVCAREGKGVRGASLAHDSIEVVDMGAGTMGGSTER
jgi:hypothetical protein